MEPHVILLSPYAAAPETQHLKEHIAAAGLTFTHFLDAHAALEFLPSKSVCAIIAKLGQIEDYPLPLVQATRSKNPPIFCCIFSATACRNALIRDTWIRIHKANMVADSFSSLTPALKIVKETVTPSGPYECPICRYGQFREDELQRHTFLYHNQESKKLFTCPICLEEKSPYVVHLYNRHGPAGRKEHPSEDAMTVKETYTFCLLVCHRKSDGKFLLVQEVASRGWWLPGGRINKDEDLIQAAIRETKEESGIDAKITGILRFEYSPFVQGYARMRVIFYGEPIDENQAPKAFPDFESMGAAWVDFNQLPNEEVHNTLASLPLRGWEPLHWFKYVRDGKPIHPINMLAHEGAPPP